MNQAFLFVLCALVAICAGQEAQCKEMHPVMLMPGIMGTVLDANADFQSGIPSDCPHQFKDQLIWIDIQEVINYKCLKSFFSSDYIPSKKDWQRIPGIEFVVPKWGSTYSVNTLAPGAVTSHLVPYYKNIIEKLESLGYKDGENLLGGGRDWKEMPTDTWVQKIKELIEGAVKKSGSKAVLMGHSMGGPYSYYFLMKMGNDWVSKYIHMYIPLAPAWMGAVKALDCMLEGLDRDVPIAGKYFAPLMRHIPSLWFLLPQKDAFKNQVLATSPSKTYTFDDLEVLLNDGNASYVEGKLAATQGMFNKVVNYYEQVPNVPVRSFIGYGKNTVKSFKFKEDIKPHDPDGTWESCSRINADGDGTVPIESLLYATDKWKKKGGDVQVYSFDGMGHLPLIKDSTVIQHIVSLFCEQ